MHEPTFLGASSAWADEEVPTREEVKRELAEALRCTLRTRIDALKQTDLSADRLILEIRCQIVECALTGDIFRIQGLLDAAQLLLEAESGLTSPSGL